MHVFCVKILLSAVIIRRKCKYFKACCMVLRHCSKRQFHAPYLPELIKSAMYCITAKLSSVRCSPLDVRFVDDHCSLTSYGRTFMNFISPQKFLKHDDFEFSLSRNLATLSTIFAEFEHIFCLHIISILYAAL